MKRHKLLKILFYLIVFILVTNFLASKFYWYSSIWYFDMIMHTLGGCFIGLLSIYFLSYATQVEEITQVSFLNVVRILFLVFIVGFLWEVFEFCFYNLIAGNTFNLLDTISDIFFDLTGGTIAILYYLKQILLNVQNKVE